MKKILIAIFLVALMAVSLAGCKSQDIVDDSGKKVGDIKVTKDGDTTTTSAHIELGDRSDEGGDCNWDGDCRGMSRCSRGKCVAVECKFVSDCDDGADLCYQGKCMTEEDLYARFDTHTLSTFCQGTCENCKEGKQMNTMVSGRGDTTYRICPDCGDDDDCVGGAWCDLGKCVMEGGSAPAEASAAADSPADTHSDSAADEDVFASAEVREYEGKDSYEPGDVVLANFYGDDPYWTTARVELYDGEGYNIIFDPVDPDRTSKSGYHADYIRFADIGEGDLVYAFKDRDFDNRVDAVVLSRGGEQLHLKYADGSEGDLDIYAVLVPIV